MTVNGKDGKPSQVSLSRLDWTGILGVAAILIGSTIALYSRVTALEVEVKHLRSEVMILRGVK